MYHSPAEELQLISILDLDLLVERKHYSRINALLVELNGKRTDNVSQTGNFQQLPGGREHAPKSFDPDFFIEAVRTLVDVDKAWVPHLDGTSLYIRPFIFANDVGLGVHASKHYIFCIITAPSGAYYAEGIDPVRIYVEDDYIRAAPGLTGFTKCGGNYAASIKAGELAEEQGFAQVLWLDGIEKKYVEEVGSMNIMFKIDGKIYTAATVGTVLPGVTRRSIIELCKDWGYEVIEGKLAIADIMAAAREGKLEEVFGTGTAAVVSPVKELRWKDETAYISGGKIGPLTQKLYDTLTGIQWGKLPDTKGCTIEV